MKPGVLPGFYLLFIALSPALSDDKPPTIAGIER